MRTFSGFTVLVACFVALLSSSVLAAAGDLDASFDTDGMVLSDIGGSTDRAYSIIQQADGKLAVAGESFFGSTPRFAIARYIADGSLDTGFNGTGFVNTAIGDISDEGFALTQQQDGKLVVAGLSWNANNNADFALVRYNVDGSLDSGFNGTGKVTTDISGSDDAAFAVAQQADGKLVAAGYSGANRDFALVRYNEDGSLDTTFNSTGMVTTAIGSAADMALALAVQPDGKLVVAGSSEGAWISARSAYQTLFAVARYNEDGTLDNSFNADGKDAGVIDLNNSGNQMAYAVTVQADGDIVLAGSTDDGSGPRQFALMRYKGSNGYRDGAFGGDGSLMTSMPGNSAIQSVIQQSDGRLLVAGYLTNGSTDVALARYLPDGMLDASFHGTGKQQVSLAAGDDFAMAVTQQRDGKLVVAGYADTGGSQYDFALLRIGSGQYDSDSDGTVDFLDADNDGDGIANPADVCPGVQDAAQADLDGNGLGDACDAGDDARNPDAHKGDRSGTAVAWADMNGDGYADAIIGAPLADVPVENATKTALLKDAGSVRILSGADGSVLRVFNGSVARENFGTALAVVDDRNGDGVPDLLLGFPLADPKVIVGARQQQLKDAGNVSLYSGSDGSLISSVADGATAGDHFGAALAVTDVNADGVQDFIVGAPQADTPVLHDAGGIIKIDGASGVEDAGWLQTGSQASEHFGAALSVDPLLGVLMVGSPGYDAETSIKGKRVMLKDAGRVQLRQGDQFGMVAKEQFGSAAGDMFGAAVAGMGVDANGDSAYDWVVGAPGIDVVDVATGKTLKDAGRLVFLSGYWNDPLPRVVTGSQAGERLGTSVDASGDINHDGHRDILIGVPGHDITMPTRLTDAGDVRIVSGIASP